jgi:hypothetical protein
MYCESICMRMIFSLINCRKIRRLFSYTPWIKQLGDKTEGDTAQKESTIRRLVRYGIFKHLRSPGIDSFLSLDSATSVAWRAGTTTIFQLGS